jgi:hypothetical protein
MCGQREDKGTDPVLRRAYRSQRQVARGVGRGNRKNIVVGGPAEQLCLVFVVKRLDNRIRKILRIIVGANACFFQALHWHTTECF